LFETHPAREAAGGGRHPVDHSQGQRGEPPRRRPVEDAGSVFDVGPEYSTLPRDAQDRIAAATSGGALMQWVPARMRLS
jgi:hypothetical protein